MAIDLEVEPANCGHSKRPRLGHESNESSSKYHHKSNIERGDIAGRGSLEVGAVDEVGIDTREGTSQGDSRVPAEGNSILELIPASVNYKKKKQMGACGGGGESRGEKGYKVLITETKTEKQWDPGSRKDS